MARPAKPVSASARTSKRQRPLTTYGHNNGKTKTKPKTKPKAGNKRTRPPKPKGRAVVDVQDEKDGEDGGGDGEWEVARISHIRHAAFRTDENEGYEYLVHWAAPGYAPTWTATALIGTLALHQFWIGSESVVIHAAGYEPGALAPAAAAAAAAAHARESPPPPASDEVGESPSAYDTAGETSRAVSEIQETPPAFDFFDLAREPPRSPDRVRQPSPVLGQVQEPPRNPGQWQQPTCKEEENESVYDV
ncbi:hypothetical protein ANO14919_140460 [Xylariales sp. No.14919]|nr:hypothetical protein ANO14919_140460 [Xylariales sp. No.14919]